MDSVKMLIRIIIHGWKLDYHLKKRHLFNNLNHPTVFRYHFEMAQYYYEKIHGESHKK